MGRLTTSDINLNVTPQEAAIDLGNSRFVLLQRTTDQSTDLTDNGNNQTSIFEFDSTMINNPLLDFEIKEFKLQFIDNAYSVSGFLGNAALTNGIQIDIKSNDVMFSYLPIKRNADFEAYLAFGSGSEVNLTLSQQSNILTASSLGSIVLRKDGTFLNPDYFRITVSDNLNGIIEGVCVILGTERAVI